MLFLKNIKTLQCQTIKVRIFLFFSPYLESTDSCKKKCKFSRPSVAPKWWNNKLEENWKSQKFAFFDILKPFQVWVIDYINIFKPSLNTNNMKRSELFDHFDIVDRYMFTHSTWKVEICGHHPPWRCATSQIAWNQRIAHDVCRPIWRIFEGGLEVKWKHQIDVFLDFIKERFEYNIQTQNEIYISHSFQKKLPWNMHFRLNQRLRRLWAKMGFRAKFEGSYIEVQALHELYHFILSINVEPTLCIPNVTFLLLIQL